jgi:3-hydroxybutyrate dehydrogenase
MFAGKVALVTGSTSGIGLNAARRLASHGCNIMLNGLIQENVRKRKKREREKKKSKKNLTSLLSLSKVSN